MSERPASTLVPALVLGILIGAGCAAGGYFIGRGAARFRSDVRTVTVKGLVEREVAADNATWTLRFRRAGDDLAVVRDALLRDREAVLGFLRARGFPETEMKREPLTVSDKFAREYGEEKDIRNRYVGSGQVVVSTTNVPLVQTSLEALDELAKAGVFIQADEGQRANPNYLYAKFNDLRPQLIADATKNARAIATQFAGETGSRVGAIRSANQGVIQIFGSDGNDESGAYHPTSTVTKHLRVVSTVEFELED